MKFHLNGWQRIGIVLSVVWIFVGGFIGYYLVAAPIREDLEYCLKDAASNVVGGPDTASCWSIYSAKRAHSDPWPTVAAAGLIPIPIAWLLVYGLIGLVRWTRAGFTQK